MFKPWLDEFLGKGPLLFMCVCVGERALLLNLETVTQGYKHLSFLVIC